MTLPSGRLVEYGRDGVRRINRVRTSVDGVVGDVVNGLGYRVDGQLIQRTWGNGLSESRDYDLQGRLLNQTLSGTDSRLYSYDANGNMLSQTATAENKEYAYDPLDRLISDATDGAEIDLSYDLNGNRLSRNAADGTLQETNDYLLSSNRIALSDLVAANPPTTTPPNERVFQYNNRGRLYQLYDEGQLVATYVYNAHGLRTRKITDQGITLYHYDQFGQLISETEADGTLIRDYVWQDFEPIAQIESNATSERIVYLHTDHLNTPRLASDGSQSVQWRWQGEAFGLTAANEDVDGDNTLTTINLRFPGQYYDQETGLHYNWNRYYDPALGRYITSDLIGLLGGLNTYSYVNNNPTNWIDLRGLLWCKNCPTEGAQLDSWGVGGTVGFTNVEYNSDEPGVTTINETLFPDIGGGFSICFDDPGAAEEGEPGSACDEDGDDPTISLPFQHFGVSFNKKKTCINIGLGLPMPNMTIPVRKY